MTGFYDKLNHAWRSQESLLCVGLDPAMPRMPDSIRNQNDGIFQFSRAIIDATAPFCSAYKPQIAHFAAHGCEDDLARVFAYLRECYPGHITILDAKRGDIGSTAAMYAREAFARYRADAVTVNPYLGGDSIAPFTAYQQNGVVLLCRTSNPGSADLQELEIDGHPLYRHIADLAVRRWNVNDNLALVVGATYPQVVAEIRNRVGDMPLLIPGIGTQQGDLQAVLRYGLTTSRTGLLINASRSICHASQGDDFAEAAATAARKLNDRINALRG